MSLRDILPVLLRRKWLLLLSGMIVACFAFAVSRMLPLYYASEGILIVESHASASGDDMAGPTVVKDVSTQMDILRSKELIRSSVGAFKAADLIPSMRLPAPLMGYLTTFQSISASAWRMIADTPRNGDPSDNVVRYVQNHLQVEARDNSNVISLRFAAGAPDVSSAVVNAIMAKYITTINSARESEI